MLMFGIAINERLRGFMSEPWIACPLLRMARAILHSFFEIT